MGWWIQAEGYKEAEIQHSTQESWQDAKEVARCWVSSRKARLLTWVQSYLKGWWQSWAVLAENIRHYDIVFRMRNTDQTFPVGSMSGATCVRKLLSVSLFRFGHVTGMRGSLFPNQDLT